MKFRNITKDIKYRSSATIPVGLPFIISRRVQTVDIPHEVEPLSVDYLVYCEVERLGLQHKCNAYVISPKRERTVYLRDGERAVFDRYHMDESYAVQLYKVR